jgi:hypothetical protein
MDPIQIHLLLETMSRREMRDEFARQQAHERHHAVRDDARPARRHRIRAVR